MSGSVRVEVAVASPAECPVAAASGAAGEAVTDVARAVAGESRAEEFSVPAAAAVDDVDATDTFELGSRRVYRFERPPEAGCVCAHVEAFGCPVSDVHARDGQLFVAFHAGGVETVREVVGDLHDAFDGVTVQRLVSADAGEEPDVVLVDRGRLTDRQFEVLETAHAMGYFEHPKRANAGEVADALGIARSTFSEHLAAAQRKLMEMLLEG